MYSANFVCQIIGACCVLHNYAMRKGLEIDLRDDLTPQAHSPPLTEGTPSAEGAVVRRRLTEDMFAR